MVTQQADHEAWARTALTAAGFADVSDVEVLAAKRIERLVVGAVADGRSLVVKRMAAHRRQRTGDAWRQLWASPFGESRRPPGVPELVAQVDAYDAIVLERVRGERLAGRRDIDSIGSRVDEVAQLLHDLHHSGVRPPVEHRIDDLLESLRSSVHERAPAEVRSDLLSVVEHLHDRRPADGEFAAVHGDFNPRNIFEAPEGLRLIDLDLLQSAEAALDLGHWSAWCWVAGLRLGRPGWRQGDELVSAYIRLGVPDGFLGRVTFHEVARLLRIGLNSSVVGRDPSAAVAVARAGLDRLAAGQPVR